MSKSGTDHNAYANNAEDYYKKARESAANGAAKNKTDKTSKKLTKAKPSGKLTKAGLKKVEGSVSAGATSNNTGVTSQPLTQSSVEASP